MTIAMTVKDYLDANGVHYDLVTHPYSVNTTQAAEKAHISGEKIAKGVVLHDYHGYLMAVIPATHRVEISKMREQFRRHLSLADEFELSHLFDDCKVGAVPPVGKAYDVEVVFDDQINVYDDIYFEAGDHTELVHMTGQDFRHLMRDVQHAQISRHV